MLKRYFEPLQRRNVDAYAFAYMNFANDMAAMSALWSDGIIWGESFPLVVNFVPMAHPTDQGKVILAEKADFSYMTDFLYTMFYRGLMAGNTPRRCHNCGRYFLLTAGYNTCYCNNIAPGETERICRKVGAHRKEAQEQAGATPEQKEYLKAYNRLKQRKNRKKISTDEWNAAVAEAQRLLDLAERGELTDVELKKKLAEL